MADEPDIVIGGVTLRREWGCWAARAPGCYLRVWRDQDGQWVGVIRHGRYELSCDCDSLADLTAAFELAEATAAVLAEMRGAAQ